MRPFVALVAGFVLSLGMFVFGAGFATWLLMAEPVQQIGPATDVADLWTEQPRRVNTAAQDLKRLPGPASPEPAIEKLPADVQTEFAEANSVGAANAVLSGSTRDDEQQFAAGISEAHAEWCYSRYRSYRLSDNSYAPYSGGRRPCVSPYSGELLAEAGEEDPASLFYADAGEDSASVQWITAEANGLETLSPAHVAECFSRYRSYRPEDNTYQPYGGGPRRQCR